MTKVALLIFAHHNYGNLKRLVYALDDPRFDIFIHVDAKARLDDFHFDTYCLKHSKLILLPDRIRSYWADISILDSMITSYRYALSADDYNWFVTLSGEDYPIRSNDDIFLYLSQHKTDCIRISETFADVRTKGYWFWKLNNKFLVRSIRKCLYFLRIQKKPYFAVNGQEWKVYISSQWHALSRESAERVVSAMENFPEIRKFFRHSHAPDELIIPTILYNTAADSKKTLYKKLSFDDLADIHFLNYNPQKESSVEIFDESAFDRAISSGKLFIRKVRAGKSDKLMELLDNFRKRR